MLLLWPEIPSHTEEILIDHKSMVVANNSKYSEEAFFRRPDIIALPSGVSFSPDIDNKNDAMFLKKRKLQDRTLEKIVFKESVNNELGVEVAMAAEAIRDVGKSRLIETSHLKLLPNKKNVEGGKGDLVHISGDIGSEAYLDWTDIDRRDLFDGNRGWDVELSLRIKNGGLPENVFLEETSGDITIDRKVVRTLSRADIWQNALPGAGTVLISFQ